jgi:antitoxin (DNA-binding transcriptional repressor) of toxin-antitoxin stability system
MEKSISATDAKVFGGVGKGWSYVIIEDGQPVAKLIPAKAYQRNAMATRAAVLARLKFNPAKNKKIGWT